MGQLCVWGTHRLYEQPRPRDAVRGQGLAPWPVGSRQGCALAPHHVLPLWRTGAVDTKVPGPLDRQDRQFRCSKLSSVHEIHVGVTSAVCCADFVWQEVSAAGQFPSTSVPVDPSDPGRGTQNFIEGSLPAELECTPPHGSREQPAQGSRTFALCRRSVEVCPTLQMARIMRAGQ